MTDSDKSRETAGASACSLNELLCSLRAHSSPRIAEPAVKADGSVRVKLRTIARLARAVGLNSYSSLTLRIAEHLEPSLQMGFLLPRDMSILTSWAEASDGYLNASDNHRHAKELVDLLGERFTRQSGCAERRYLLRGLLQESGGETRRSGACGDFTG